MSRTGFTIVEILISLVIITLSISTLAISYREFSITREKQNEIPSKVLLVYSAIQTIDQKVKNGTLNGMGTILDVPYSFKSQIIEKKIVSRELETKSEKYRLYLIKVTLNIFNKEYSWKTLRYEKVR